MKIAIVLGLVAAFGGFVYVLIRRGSGGGAGGGGAGGGGNLVGKK
jgi:hypothetical protein